MLTLHRKNILPSKKKKRRTTRRRNRVKEEVKVRGRTRGHVVREKDKESNQREKE